LSSFLSKTFSCLYSLAKNARGHWPGGTGKKYSERIVGDTDEEADADELTALVVFVVVADVPVDVEPVGLLSTAEELDADEVPVLSDALIVVFDTSSLLAGAVAVVELLLSLVFLSDGADLVSLGVALDSRVADNDSVSDLSDRLEP
jgi:hypothetical protein